MDINFGNFGLYSNVNRYGVFIHASVLVGGFLYE